MLWLARAAALLEEVDNGRTLGKLAGKTVEELDMRSR